MTKLKMNISEIAPYFQLTDPKINSQIINQKGLNRQNINNKFYDEIDAECLFCVPEGKSCGEYTDKDKPTGKVKCNLGHEHDCLDCNGSKIIKVYKFNHTHEFYQTGSCQGGGDGQDYFFSCEICTYNYGIYN